MPCPPPPFPLSEEEFDKRWKAGARTMEELDPALMAWCNQGVWLQRFVFCVSIGLLLFTIGLIVYCIATKQPYSLGE